MIPKKQSAETARRWSFVKESTIRNHDEMIRENVKLKKFYFDKLDSNSNLKHNNSSKLERSLIICLEMLANNVAP